MINLFQYYGTAAIFAAVFSSFLLLAGCSEAEKRGYSSIPQNSPSSWEVNPFGDNLQN